VLKNIAIVAKLLHRAFISSSSIFLAANIQTALPLFYRLLKWETLPLNDSLHLTLRNNPLVGYKGTATSFAVLMGTTPRSATVRQHCMPCIRPRRHGFRCKGLAPRQSLEAVLRVSGAERLRSVHQWRGLQGSARRNCQSEYTTSQALSQKACLWSRPPVSFNPTYSRRLKDSGDPHFEVVLGPLGMESLGCLSRPAARVVRRQRR